MKILLALVAGFASGVFLRSLFVIGWPFVALALLFTVLCAGAALRHPRLPYILGALFFLCCALGMIRTAGTEKPLPQAFVAEVGHRVAYEGVVVSDPDVRDTSERIAVQVTEGKSSVRMLAVAPRGTGAVLGDRVRVSGTLAFPEAFAAEGGRVFRYDKYLERDGIRFLLNFAYVRVEGSAPWWNIPAELARIKHVFIHGLDQTLPEPFASLAEGIVIGGKSGLGDTLQAAFIRSGLVQVIVLSGYNIMVIAEWVMAACTSVRLSRRASAGVGILAILAFVGMAGTSATSVRAMLMAFVALFARATGRSYAASRALLVTVFLMLAWNPLLLVFDPGFGLSVTATAGLIWLAPGIEKIFSRNKTLHTTVPGTTPPVSFWENAIATTLAAQIAVLPLLLYDTGNLSFVALPANLVIMPMVPLAMAFSAVAGLAGIIFGGAAQIIGIVAALPAYALNAYILWVAQAAARIPFAAITLPLFSSWFVALAYAALIYTVASKRFSTTLQLRLAKKAST